MLKKKSIQFCLMPSSVDSSRNVRAELANSFYDLYLEKQDKSVDSLFNICTAVNDTNTDLIIFAHNTEFSSITFNFGLKGSYSKLQKL